MMDGQRKQGEIVGVRFTPSGRVYFFAPGNVVVSVGDRVEVETDVGYREGDGRHRAGPGAVCRPAGRTRHDSSEDWVMAGRRSEVG